MPKPREVTLLWALRSRCNLGCKYCYFGTLEEHREAPPAQPGQLSHLSQDDLPLTDITRFLSTIGDSGVKRVFIAGGEPLNWSPISAVIETLTSAGIEVTVCTNGIPLNRPTVRKMLIGAGVHGVSVSLDSADPTLNDRYRPAHKRNDGWSTVVSGIQALLADRSDQPDSPATPKVGLYCVLTRLTLPGLPDTARFAAELGLDYFVAQPIALDRGHALHEALVLREQDLDTLARVFAEVYEANLGLHLPSPRYPERIASTVKHELQMMHSCFGGHQLAFIEPDGSVWDCPSSHKIAAIARAGTRRSITTRTAAELFPARVPSSGCDCPLFSGDCVNMLPLMEDFDRFLATSGGNR
ncbi:radical SAM protein [Amycolatopsis pigmentata]|uniref:Radical SAM protein n=1 Tax=Amycolatopsis pigmentata TaxID=450801 RepID=A0ABW5GBZ0_9PSEU